MKEILTNIISYGYRDNREHQVKVRLSVQLAEVSVEIEDDGQPFNPLEAPAPDVTTVGRKEDRWTRNSSCVQTHGQTWVQAPKREKSTDH